MGFFDTIGNMFGASDASDIYSFKPQAQQFASQDYVNSLEKQAQNIQGRPDTSSFAEALLNQAQNTQTAQANALAASTRGNVNPALLQRNVMRQASEAGQQAAGQAGLIRAQEALQNRQLNDQMALNYRNMGLNAAQAQAGMNQQNQSLQANLAGQRSQQQAQAMGGLFNALGGAAASGFSKMGAPAAPASTMGTGATDMADMSQLAAFANQGGYVHGGQVLKEGDHPENDTVPAMLSPGEIVIPRSKAKDADKAKEFIDHLKGSKSKSDAKGYGKVLEANRKLRKRIAELEAGKK